jgi:hypothetical protein
MPRQRLYDSNAERQAAYRARLAHRQAGDLDAGRVAELETALAAATSRALAAEDRAAVAEGQLTALKLTIAALQHRLEQTTVPPVGPEPAAKMNRQARRQAERDARRNRH